MNSQRPIISLDLVRRAAAATGIQLLSITSAEDLTQDGEHLLAWQSAGLAGELEYMLRGRELLASPQRVFQGACSVVTVGVFYDSGPAPDLVPGTGRVARYAWGRDYHKVLRRVLEQFCEEVRRQAGVSFNHRVFSDSVPLLERALARRAGMGFVGKNTMLIVPGRGSFLFLGEVLWDVHVEGAAPDSDEQALVSRACGACTRCLDRCPTSAFLSERVLDAKRCIAYLTIEKRGVLTREERRMIGPWVFGCDVCQEVCPYNYTAIKTRKGADVAALSRESGVGPLLDLADVLSIRTHEAFAARYAGTAIMRARREGLVRNAVCVATNTSQSTLLPNVVNVAGGDPSPVVRAHALWAAWALAGQVGEGRAAVQALRDKCFGDPDEGVRREAGALDGE